MVSIGICQIARCNVSVNPGGRLPLPVDLPGGDSALGRLGRGRPSPDYTESGPPFCQRVACP